MAETFDQFEKRNRELFLWLFLFQLYLEGVKLRFANEYQKRLQLLLQQFMVFINGVRYQTLDGFTKAELHDFIFALKQAEANFYSRYVDDLIKELQAFIGTDRATAETIYTTAFGKSLAEAETDREHDTAVGIKPSHNNAAIWSTFKNTPVGATGMGPIEMVNDMALTHLKRIGMVTQRAYVNGWDKPTFIKAIKGHFTLFQNQGTATLATIVQHAHAMSNIAVGSIFLGAYMWCSILDERTTEFCIEHNGRVYANGAGPVPPGHYGCRAHTMPVDPVQAAVDLPTRTAYVGTLAVSLQDAIRGISSIRSLTDDEFRETIISLIQK